MNSKYTISLLDNMRIPCLILVLFIHGNFILQNASIYTNSIIYLFSISIASSAVPLFFFISGFLYFRNYETFSKEEYLRKTRKRIRSLLVPMLFWNLLYCLLFIGVQIFFPNIVNGGIPKFDALSIDYWKWILWGTKNGGPIDYPLWYIRDLFVVVLTAPIIYFFLFKNRILAYFTVFAIMLSYLFDIEFNILGNNLVRAYCFFCIGSIVNLFPSHTMGGGKTKVLCLVLFMTWLLYCVIESIFINVDDMAKIFYIFHNIRALVGVFGLLSLSYLLYDKLKKIRTKMGTDCVFFIFAIHGPIITVTDRLLINVCSFNSVITLFLYFGNIVAIFITCYVLYMWCKKFPILVKYFLGR